MVQRESGGIFGKGEMILGASRIINEDARNIYVEISGALEVIEGSTFLITGGAGFLGGYFLDLIKFCNENVFMDQVKVICADSFITGIPERVSHLLEDDNFKMLNVDISRPFDVDCDIDYIINAASIASPTFYRKYPIETIKANVLGLLQLIELGMKKKIKSFLNLSSSEIYGDPDPGHIPTGEDYKGNVSCTGPRACYDESKRLGETICVNYFREYGLPVKVARPFNVYGPGLRLDDRRVIPDFFHDAIYKRSIEIFSDGSPTRSFCYASDAVKGFMLALLSDYYGEAFNIGNDSTEVTMKELALTIASIVGNVNVVFRNSEEADYLTDNPTRRRPDLSKAKACLNYQPSIELREGLERLYKWYVQS